MGVARHRWLELTHDSAFGCDISKKILVVVCLLSWSATHVSLLINGFSRRSFPETTRHITAGCVDLARTTKPGKWMMVIGWFNSPPITLQGVLGAKEIGAQSLRRSLTRVYILPPICCICHIYVKVSMVVIRPLLAG